MRCPRSWPTPCRLAAVSASDSPAWVPADASPAADPPRPAGGVLVIAPVSVLTATAGRRPAMLAEAVASVRGQVVAPLEHIIVDDGSFSVPPIDGVRLRAIPHSGLGPARNAGLADVRGVAVALLDDDDVWYPNHLATVWRAMQLTGADVVYADCAEVGRRDGYSIRVRDFDADLLERENFICVPATLVRLDALRSVGGFAGGALEDWDTWKRMAAAGASFVHVPVVTVSYRFHSDNLTYGGVDPLATREQKRLREAAERGEISWDDYTRRSVRLWA